MYNEQIFMLNRYNCLWLTKKKKKTFQVFKKMFKDSFKILLLIQRLDEVF